MKTIDLIRWAMQLSDDAVNRLVVGLESQPLLQPTSKGGNHPLWVVGHLAVIEGSLAQTLLGEENPVEHWWPLFGMGTEPHADASKYPSFEEVLGTFRRLRARNLEMLDQLGESRMTDAPKQVPPGFEEFMRTIGQTYLLTALHTMGHIGQLADVRRAAGLKRYF